MTMRAPPKVVVKFSQLPGKPDSFASAAAIAESYTTRTAGQIVQEHYSYKRPS